MTFDTHNPKLGQTSHIEGTSFTILPSLQTPNPSFRSPGHIYSDQLATNLGVSTTPLTRKIHYNNSQNSGKSIFTTALLYSKRIQIRISQEIHQRRTGSVLKTNFPLSFSCGVRMCVWPSWHINVWQYRILPTSEGHLNFSIQNFGGGELYYTGIINWITGARFNFQRLG